VNLAKYGTGAIEEGMSEKEITIRTQHNKEKLEKLKNPNYFVSDTRTDSHVDLR
jgi:hypothetical protein